MCPAGVLPRDFEAAQQIPASHQFCFHDDNSWIENGVTQQPFFLSGHEIQSEKVIALIHFAASFPNSAKTKLRFSTHGTINIEDTYFDLYYCK